jgi:DNA-binding CsgD family transcriptional regulator
MQMQGAEESTRVMGVAPDLILALGQDRFGPLLLDVLAEQTGADLLSAFAVSASAPPRLLLAFGRLIRERTFPWTASTRYAQEFWRHDPTFSKVVQVIPGKYGILRQSGRSIQNSGYRTACYEQPGVLERISIHGQPGDMPLMVNLYRLDANGPFSEASIDKLGQIATTILALVAKNAAMDEERIVPALHPKLETVSAALKARAPQLSPREAEVCAALLVGLSLKEIARCTGLEASSIVTYRKRAYGKLAITTRRDLGRIYDPSGAALIA